MAEFIPIWNYFFGLLMLAGSWSIFFTNENRVWQFFEYSLSGVIVGYLTAVGVKETILLGVNPLVNGEFLYIIPLILGVLMYSRYIPKFSYMARWPVAILIGTLLGVVSRATITTDIIGQIIPMISIPNNFNMIALQIMTFVTLAYFIFTFGSGDGSGAQAGWHKKLLYIGRIFIMIAMGAAFSNKFLGLLPAFVDRINHIFFNWPF